MASSSSPAADIRYHQPSEPRWPPELLGTSPLARRAREDVWRAAAAGRALIVAEPGLAAEAVARTIHQCGSGDSAPFVVVDCRRSDPEAVEGALFGDTLRRSSRRDGGGRPMTVTSDCGLLAASGGSLYLANVVDLPACTQERLARIVRDGEVRVKGSNRRVALDVRVVAGCEMTMEHEVAQGAFRADLYRRLAIVRVDVPPLRLRPEDLPAVARAVIAEVCAGQGEARGVTRAALALVAALPWPGNVRELRDVLERAAASAPPGPVRVEDVLGHLGSGWRRARMTETSLREARRQFEREYIAAVLREHGWRMSEAARALGMQRTNLYRKVRQLDIPAPRVRPR